MGWKPNLPKSTTKIQDAPDIFMENWKALEDFTAQEHVSIASSEGSGRHRSGHSSVLMVNETAVITAIASPPPCAIAYDTTLQIFEYFNGTVWVNLGGAIEAGTKMAIYADTAPIGWTIQDLNDKYIYVTKGSVAGGETGGGIHSTGSHSQPTHVHGTAACALDVDQIPMHRHYTNCLVCGASGAWEPGYPCPAYIGGASTSAAVWVDPTGSGEAHTHGDLLPSATPDTWRMLSYAFIVCRKD